MTGGHIAPERLIDADAGRLGARQVARIDRHVAGCSRCAGARERLARVRAAMSEIAAAPAPELGWDHIGVRVYWSTSSARHAALRDRARPWWRRPAALVVASTVGLAAATGAALAMFSADEPRATADVRPALAPVAAPKVATAPATIDDEPAELRGVITFARGEVAVGDGPMDRPDLDALFASSVGQGDQLGTREGRLVVQFGQGSGFALAPASRVTLRRFDARAVELVVDVGSIEVELAPRGEGQTFAVVAGRHRVSVVGTAFQVSHRGGQVDVECARGRVLVSDGEQELALTAGEQLRVLEQAVVDRAARQVVDPRRLAVLERTLARPLLPAWTESLALFDTSSTLEVTAPAGRAVRVDGVEVGAGSFALRVMSGRHHLQVSNGAGGFSHGAWIDAEPRARHQARAGASGAVRLSTGEEASLDASRDGEPSAAVVARRTRRDQLRRALVGSRRARQCMMPLEKRDLVEGSRVIFDIGVNADGSQGHLNVVRSNVPPEVERCLRAVVGDVELRDGPAATVRYQLAF
jgi:ferric-dicitrate binding protein FerR (iron transport regulator)